MDDTHELHVFDLPQLYAKPSGEELLKALSILRIGPSSFSQSPEEGVVLPSGNVSHYLTSTVASKLLWIDDEAVRENIWEEASARLSERSGRTAMPAVSRKFSIPLPSGPIDIVLYEPSLTADNLGLKTWVASFLLANRLAELKIPTCNPDKQLRILELGSGTGLAGIAAAAIFHANVHLTDLPDIVPNLSRNAHNNRDTISSHGGTASTGALDWSIQEKGFLEEGEKYPLILAADPLYSPEHPRLLVQTVENWLQRSAKARFVVEFPLRDAYSEERRDFSRRVDAIGLALAQEGEEVGYDDWQGRDGGLVDVKCWWGVFKWKDLKD